MLITSKIDDTKWLWVNVPKTASTAVMRTFFPLKEINEQEHQTWSAPGKAAETGSRLKDRSYTKDRT